MEVLVGYWINDNRFLCSFGTIKNKDGELVEPMGEYHKSFDRFDYYYLYGDRVLSVINETAKSMMKAAMIDEMEKQGGSYEKHSQ